MIRSWPGKFRSKRVTRCANSSGRSRARSFSRVCSPPEAFPMAAARIARPARAVSATILACGNGEDPSPVPVVPK